MGGAGTHAPALWVPGGQEEVNTLTELSGGIRPVQLGGLIHLGFMPPSTHYTITAN